MYEYHAAVTDVYDGDTITASIDLGFNVHLHNQKFRLLYVDAPEIRGNTKELGMLSKIALENKILNKTVLFKSFKDKKDKYGRWLCEIWFDGININQWLIDEGYAVVYQEDLKLLNMEES